MKLSVLLAFAPLIFSLSACGQVDRIRTVQSPDPSVYLTVETTFGASAISSDFTNIYAHFSQGGSSKKQLIVSGEYLEDVGLSWTSPGLLKICLHGGFTNEFHNDVTLELGTKFNRIQSYLDERCSLAAMKAYH